MSPEKSQTVQRIRALAKRPGTEGERQAAQSALDRIKGPPRLTEALVKQLTPPSKGSKIYYDQPDDQGNNCTRGFGVRVTAAGVRAYVLNYRAKSGREGRITIGRPPQWTLTAARAEARTLKAKIDLGADPAKDAQDKRTGDNVNSLFDQFIATHVTRKREATRKEYVSIIDKYIRPVLGSAKVAEVEFADIDRLHRKISAHAPYRANRMLAILSKAFNLAIKWKLRPDNPVKFIERNPERPRERFLQESELQRLQGVLADYSNQDVANVVRLLLLTGARLSEVLSARRDAFDLRAGVWTKPSAHTKQKRDHRTPLNAEAVRLIKSIKKEVLFVGIDKDVMERHWRVIRARAALDDVRLHDMRHSFASVLASSGQSLPIIGALLGHTQAQTTARYSHLLDSVLRKATERAGKVLATRRRDS